MLCSLRMLSWFHCLLSESAVIIAIILHINRLYISLFYILENKMSPEDFPVT